MRPTAVLASALARLKTVLTTEVPGAYGEGGSGGEGEGGGGEGGGGEGGSGSEGGGDGGGGGKGGEDGGAGGGRAQFETMPAMLVMFAAQKQTVPSKT